MDIRSMSIVQKKGKHNCLLGDWKGVDFDIFFVKDPN